MNLYRVAYTHEWPDGLDFKREDLYCMVKAYQRDGALAEFVRTLHEAVAEKLGHDEFTLRVNEEAGSIRFTVIQQYTWRESDSYIIRSVDFVCVG